MRLLRLARAWLLPTGAKYPRLTHNLSAAVMFAALVSLILLTEDNIRDFAFALAVTMAAVGGIMLMTRRLLISLTSALLIAVGIIGVSRIKADILNIQLHSYDIYLFLLSWENLKYLSTLAPRHVLALAVFAAGSIASLSAMARIDRIQSHRGLAVVVLCGSLALALLARNLHIFPNFQLGVTAGGYLSAFYLSWGQTLHALRHGQVLAAAPRGSVEKEKFRLPESCEGTAARTRPNIILIHQESMVPPSFYANLAYDRSLDRHFESDDGRLRRLRVETYVGGSWLTQLSVLTGMSTRMFGDMRFYLLNFLRGKINESLPQQMKLCGYRTTFQTVGPGSLLFANFFKSIGFDDFYDRKSQGTDRFAERDAFYYGKYLSLFRQHRLSSDKPMFTMIETIATHWPYDKPFMPEVSVAGGGPGTHPEVHEYLRRMSLAAIDFERFMDDLRAAFPGEAFLVVSYGDHRPHVNRYLQADIETQLATFIRRPISFDSDAYVTYYSVRSLNYKSPALPDYDTLDVPYLPVVIAQISGLPLSDASRARAELMRHCNGIFADCPDKQAILAFHRRLLDSGIVLGN